ncbi:uncharacterized protein LOC142980766 [Anticarsia gemmatalis]|uniref:uncharacterized protein LOC142980766 n=1 Tax=Anticarsia gemmatalis TaxID=129554 RepID=UPI003F771A1D
MVDDYCQAEDYYYQPHANRSTLSGIQAYRSALTLDWLAAEDQRQRELADAFETEVPVPNRVITSDCIGYSRPASGKVARLMLELLKNLEGDDSTVVSEMIQALVRSKLLVETSMLDAEPDLDALVKTPGVMMGEPHTTFPRILAMAWMTVTDPVTTKKFGWCPLHKVNRYLSVTKPVDVAKHTKALEPIIARARFIMEEFIQHVTPINMYDKKPTAAMLKTPPVTMRAEASYHHSPKRSKSKATASQHQRTVRMEMAQAQSKLTTALVVVEQRPKPAPVGAIPMAPAASLPAASAHIQCLSYILFVMCFVYNLIKF